jgi:hypothetical protein
MLVRQRPGRTRSEPEPNRKPSSRSVMVVVKLNVGGKLFTTTKESLIGTGSDTGSLLARMFDDDQDLGKETVDGGIFFDRDGDLFIYILAYLRDGEKQVACTPEEKLDSLKIEASFFQLTGKCSNRKKSFLKAHHACTETIYIEKIVQLYR